jgi:hypothetical protein
MSYGTTGRMEITNRFNGRIVDILEKELGGVVEIPEAGALGRLDSAAMIDGLLTKDGGVFGLAIRVQYGQCWKSFTLRLPKSGHKGELAKLRESLKNDGRLFPIYFCQLYFESTEPSSAMLGAAYIPVTDLARYCATTPAYQIEVRQAGADGNSFHVVWWDSLSQTKIIYNHSS